MVKFPIKMHKLGEPPLTVNASADYDRYIREGYTVEEQRYIYQSFPKVLYHAVKPWVSAKNLTEYEDYMTDGYSENPYPAEVKAEVKQEAKELTEADLVSHIKFHEREADRLWEDLKKKFPKEIAKPAQAEITKEPEPEAIPIKKRGRKPKAR